MRRLNITKLSHYFLVLCQEQHFGDAARRLGMTQPPLSQAIQRLESSLGVRLFVRTSRGVTITEAGTALEPLARALLDAESALRQAAALHAADRDEWGLGVPAELPIAVAAALVTADPSHQHTPFALVTAPTTSTIDALLAGRLGAAVITHPAVTDGLDGGEVVRLRTALLLPADLKVKTNPRLRDLMTLPLATRPRQDNPPVHDLLLDTLREHGVALDPIIVEDDRAALAMVASGRACALTADPTLHSPGVQRCHVPGDVLPLRVRVVQCVGGTAPDLIDTLTDALRAAGRR